MTLFGTSKRSPDMLGEAATLSLENRLMLKLPIYMDNHATTRTDPRVVAAMLPYFSEKYGNASSRHHAFGREAEAAVELARQQVADLLGAAARDIIFTSGATESNNLAIKGVAGMYGQQGNHLVTAVTEHKAVLDPCKRLEREGFAVTFLPVDRQGRVSVEQVEAALTERTILVSIMSANNEVGTLAPLAAIGRLCKARGVLLHTDAAQAAGKVPLHVDELGIDLLSLTAHKIYGPKGIGALYVRGRHPRVRLEPLLDGGGHERGLRSGTLPVPGIAGFGLACQLCRQELADEGDRLRRLRDRLRDGIMNRLGDVVLNGPADDRLPGNLNLSFPFVEGEALLMSLKDVAVSAGSACTSANPEPSYVLRALGLSDALAHGSLRFGLGRFTTVEEVDHVIAAVVQAVEKLRALSPLHELARREQGGSGVASSAAVV